MNLESSLVVYYLFIYLFIIVFLKQEKSLYKSCIKNNKSTIYTLKDKNDC